MKQFIFVAQIMLLLQLFQVKCDFSSLRNGTNYKKFFLNGIKSVHSLHVSTENYEPFMYRDKNGHSEGIEYELIKTIAGKEQLNLSFTFVDQFRPLHLEQFIFSLVSASFSFPLTKKYKNTLGSSDLLAGGIFPNVSFQHDWTISKPYYQDDFTWCIQRAKFFPLILNLSAAAPPEIWILTIFGVGHGTALVFYIMVQFDFKYKQRNNRDWPYMLFLVALPAGSGVNQRFQPKSIIFRMFYGFVLIMSLFIWQIIFFYGPRYLQVPVRRAHISTVSEIVANEFRLMGSTEVLGLISFDERFKISQIDSFSVCPSIDRCLDRLKNDENDDMAVGGSRQRILNSPSYIPSQIFCFARNENIAGYQPALLTRKDFALNQRIDKIIRNAFEGGLFVKWDRDNQRKKERLVPYTPRLILTLGETAVLFVFFLIGGWILSILIFLNERFIYQKMQQPNRFRIWTFLEQMVDGERHYFKNLVYKH